MATQQIDLASDAVVSIEFKTGGGAVMKIDTPVIVEKPVEKPVDPIKPDPITPTPTGEDAFLADVAKGKLTKDLLINQDMNECGGYEFNGELHLLPNEGGNTFSLRIKDYVSGASVKSQYVDGLSWSDACPPTPWNPWHIRCAFDNQMQDANEPAKLWFMRSKTPEGLSFAAREFSPTTYNNITKAGQRLWDMSFNPCPDKYYLHAFVSSEETGHRIWLAKSTDGMNISEPWPMYDVNDKTLPDWARNGRHGDPSPIWYDGNWYVVHINFGTTKDFTPIVKLSKGDKPKGTSEFAVLYDINVEHPECSRGLNPDGTHKVYADGTKAGQALQNPIFFQQGKKRWFQLNHVTIAGLTKGCHLLELPDAKTEVIYPAVVPYETITAKYDFTKGLDDINGKCGFQMQDYTHKKLNTVLHPVNGLNFTGTEHGQLLRRIILREAKFTFNPGQGFMILASDWPYGLTDANAAKAAGKIQYASQLNIGNSIGLNTDTNSCSWPNDLPAGTKFIRVTHDGKVAELFVTIGGKEVSKGKRDLVGEVKLAVIGSAALSPAGAIYPYKGTIAVAEITGPTYPEVDFWPSHVFPVK